MKLTKNLKEQIKSKTIGEEKEEAVEQATILLSDDQLDMVAGGQGEPTGNRPRFYWVNQG